MRDPELDSYNIFSIHNPLCRPSYLKYRSRILNKLQSVKMKIIIQPGARCGQLIIQHLSILLCRNKTNMRHSFERIEVDRAHLLTA